MIAKYGKILLVFLSFILICASLLFFGNVLEWKLTPIQIFEWEFIPFQISKDFSKWSSFGDYLGGVLGVTLSFVIILMLVIIERERDKLERKKQEISEIFITIKQNRELFNSIKDYKEHYPKKIPNPQPHGNETRTATTEKTDPEMFKNIYKTLTNYYRHEFTTEIKNSDTNANLFSSIPEDILFELYKEEWKKHILWRKEINDHEDEKKINEEISEIYKNIFDNAKPKTEQIEEFKKLKFNKDRPVRKIFLARNPTHKASNYIDIFIILKAIRKSYKQLYDESGYLFGHYFRNQYYVFDTIHYSKELSENEKEKYFKLYRSHLSCYESVLMFYNALSEFSSKEYNDYIIKNNMLDNLESAHFIHKEFFKKLRQNNDKELLSVIDEVNKLNGEM